MRNFTHSVDHLLYAKTYQSWLKRLLPSETLRYARWQPWGEIFNAYKVDIAKTLIKKAILGDPGDLK